MMKCGWIFVWLATLCAVGLAAPKELGVESLIFVGTRTGAGSEAKGIYLFRMRTSDNPDIPEFVTVTPLGVVAETESPTFLEIDAKRGRLFCVNEVEAGMVSAYAIEAGMGKLTLLNKVASGGRRPGHLVMDREGKFLVVTNEGSVAVLPVEADGKLREAVDVKAVGKAGGVAVSPDNRFVLVCDAGRDAVEVFGFAGGKLEARGEVKAGKGPRRLVFGGGGKFAYVVNELSSTVTVFAYEAGTGGLKELQTLSTVPEYFDGPNRAMEIAVHPSGKGLLVSNCGHHSVVLFTIDPEKGTLTYVEDQSTYGTMPEHFGMDGDGKHVVVANRESGSILILRAPESARVKPAGNVVKTPEPTCAKFLVK